ncbi:MAG: kelch repeat-containing protein [Candidatus Dormibacter sp.]
MRAALSVLAVLTSGMLGSASMIVTAATPAGTSLGGWSTAGALRTGRAQHTATRLLDGRVLVTGGRDRGDQALASTELFDPKTGRWQAGAALDAARVDQTATLLLNGRVLVAGGFDRLDARERSLATAEIFDPGRNRWTPAAPMAVTRARHTATLLADGRVLVVGGYSAPTPGKLGGFAPRAEVYDPIANRWSDTNTMGTGGRQGHSATRLLDGRVLVVGGEGTLGGNQSAELYDPATNTWAFAHFPLAPHVGHTATLLASGQVLIVGGAGSISPTLHEPAALATAEIYQPGLNQWTLLTPMHTTRDHHTATLLDDGRVLVVGGAYTSTPLPELYDAAANTWRLLPGDPMDRYAHTATLLENGRVLVAGGFGQSAATTWVYDPAGRASTPAAAPGPPFGMVAVLGALLLLLLAWLWFRRATLHRPSWPRPAGDEWLEP